MVARRAIYSSFVRIFFVVDASSQPCESGIESPHRFPPDGSRAKETSTCPVTTIHFSVRLLAHLSLMSSKSGSATPTTLVAMA